MRALTLFILLSFSAAVHAQFPSLRIPRVTRAPKLADFLNGTPREAEAVVTDFRQFDPQDGAPISQPTTAYLSYDDRNLYVAFVCKDDPALIRARIAKRKDILADDRITINLDTFHDHKRAYFFDVNPYGVQLDGVTTDGQGDDFSFETLWYTDSKITADGYVVLETIPFRSIRFPDAEKQTWGVTLIRFIQRNNEFACWPHISRRKLPQFVGQFGDLEGLERISPGRNLQFIPYAQFSHSRFLDTPAAGPAGFLTDRQGRAGLDAKAILKDSLTLDATLNPDFSQVESDEPQVTVNQRYEVFYPERRPFFMENAGFFETPETLFFSRRFIDPQFGARLTGKVGRWAIGALVADDRAPGRIAASDDPLRDTRATGGVFRLTREFGKQSHIGTLITDRELGPDSNRVASVDTRLQLGGNWTFSGQAVTSRTANRDSDRLSGQALHASIRKSTRHFSYESEYTDRSPGFRSELGYVPRVDIRELEHEVQYLWRPKRGRIVSFGPSIQGMVNWNRLGRVQDWEVELGFSVELPRQTFIRVGREESFELFRGIGFRKDEAEASIESDWLRWLSISGSYNQGAGVNYYPASGLLPFSAHQREASFGVILRPTSRLRLDESYLYSRLAARATIFNNHIVRSKLNYQFSRALSLRAILDYNGVLPNASLVSLDRAKRINADVLFTWLVHPGTALYAGYAGARENWALNPLESPSLRRTGFPELSTARQFFIKLSYLFRY